MVERQGELFDIGYQRYEGPREGRWRSRFAVFENGVRTVLGIGRGPRAKILPVLLFLSAMLPAVIFVLVISVTGIEGLVPGPSDYYEIVSAVLFVFAAIMAPELLIPDRRDRVLHLYLVRPLTVTDYLGGRVAAFFVIILALVYSGQIVLQIGFILAASSPLDYIRGNWMEVPRFLASGFLIALFITIIPMAAAGFIARRAFATAFVIGLWFISASVVGGLSNSNVVEVETGRTNPDGSPQVEIRFDPILGEATRWVALLDIGAVPLHLNAMIFQQDIGEFDNPALREASKLPPAVPVLWYLLFIAVPAMLLWNQYRRMRL